MLEQILVPLDTSCFAEHALGYAVVLARRTRAKAQLVCVHTVLPADLTVGQADEYLARIAAEIEPDLPNQITYRVITDEGELSYPPADSSRVAELLSRYAQDCNADMIVMATHGRGGLRRALLGSVADSLIRIAPRPVLLIRPQREGFDFPVAADRRISHVVIPVDGSGSAEQVIPYAVQLGSVFGARYSLVRVISPAGWVRGPWSIPETPQSRLQVAEYLERLATPMRTQGAVVTTRVLEGRVPGAAIVQYAERNTADVIALATAGFGRIHRLLLGSVTDKVVRSSEVPVLVCNTRRLESTRQTEREAAGTSAAALI